MKTISTLFILAAMCCAQTLPPGPALLCQTKDADGNKIAVVCKHPKLQKFRRTFAKDTIRTLETAGSIAIFGLYLYAQASR